MQEQKNKNLLIAQHYKMRYYQDEFPKEGELVMGQSQKSQENGCYVALLEYNNKVGMMPINQYTTTMRKALHRAMKVGKKEILRVIRVDKEKGYIDLSKKQVLVDDQTQGQQKYANSTQLHSILIHISQHTKVPIIQLYEKYVWPIYRVEQNKHPLTFFKQCLTSQSKMKELNIDNEAVRETLISELKRRFKRPVIKSMANFSVQCRTFQGIAAIKRTLQAGIQQAKANGYDVKIFIIGAPKYTCQVSSITVQAGRQALMAALNKIQAEIKLAKGKFTLDMPPYIVGDTNQHIKDMIKGEQVQMVVDNDDDDMGQADD